MQHFKQFINNEWVDSLTGKTRNIINPSNGEVFARVPDSGIEDVDKAVNAARTAFDKGIWSSLYAADRAKYLLKLAGLMGEHFATLVDLEVKNNGKPKREAEFDVFDAINCLEYYAGLATKIHGETILVPPGNFSYTVREPIGVCGQIVPWNYPLLMAVWKLAPALAAGNTIVLKPSELTPLSVLYLTKLIKEADFPKGVVNILSGDGPICGDALVRHPMVDKIAFTGGTVTGKSIMKAAADTLKKISLELGGKNPAIIFEDANLELTLDWCLFASFANQGQVCSAASRMYVQEGIYEEFIQRYVDGSRKIRVGDGLDIGIEMGPLISSSHYEKVKNYIRIGIEQGATLLTGGDSPPNLEPKNQQGYFLSPAVFVDVNHDMSIMREEIFGPVICIQKFKTEEEVIELANDSLFGLAAGVFTRDLTRFHRILPKLKAGIIWANYYHPTFNEQPWGGYKQSGIGRELGTYGMEAYLETKQVNINLESDPVGWYDK